MKVIFLDYDGVVNTPMWELRAGKWICSFAFPKDNTVNNPQAVQWVSEFCENYGYSIVVSSTWRHKDNYKECLINGGLREGIKILGKTPYVRCGHRGDEISQWLEQHPDVDQYLIFDDDTDMTIHKDRLVKCDTSVGFLEREFERAEELHWRYTSPVTEPFSLI